MIAHKVKTHYKKSDILTKSLLVQMCKALLSRIIFQIRIRFVKVSFTASKLSQLLSIDLDEGK